MDIFLTLLSNLAPLYILIALGYVAARWSGVDSRSLANLAIYIVVPIVTFGFIALLDFRPEYIFLPIIFFTVQTTSALIGLRAGQAIYPNNKCANLLALLYSIGNTGYFGLPLVIMLFDTQAVTIYMFIMVSGPLFESTVGYYIAARGNFSARDSISKLAKFPNIYAIILGLIWNFCGFEIGDTFLEYWEYFKGVYIVVGMMIIGAALSNVKKFKFSPSFTALAFAGKFVVKPCLMLAIIMIDKMWLHIYDAQIHELLLIIVIVPFAANITAFATQLNLKPEMAATTVLLGTVFALFFIPLVLSLT